MLNHSAVPAVLMYIFVIDEYLDKDAVQHSKMIDYNYSLLYNTELNSDGLNDVRKKTLSDPKGKLCLINVSSFTAADIARSFSSSCSTVVMYNL